MSKLFNLDNPLMRFLGRVGDIMILDLLWILCSFPIVTIGASSVALYTLMFRLLEGEDDRLCRNYFRIFVENIKQGTVLWIVVIIVSLLVGAEVYFVSQLVVLNEILKIILWVSQFLVILACASIMLYAFAIQSGFNNSIKNIVLNSIILGYSYFLQTVLMVFIDIVIVAVGILIMPLLAFSLPVLINCLFMRKIFANHLPEDVKTPV